MKRKPMTNREIISKVRKSIQEKDTDSTYTNKFLYSKIVENAKWLISREIKSGGIWTNSSLFQTRRCMPVIKVPKSDPCCPINTGCVMYRTRYKLDSIWNGIDGPIILSVTSLDGSTRFDVLSPEAFENKKKNPYSKYSKELYAIIDSDGFLWWEEQAPKKVHIRAFFKEDINNKYSCKNEPLKCNPFMDRLFIIPGKIEAEIIDKVVEQVLGRTKAAPADESIDKSENRPM